LLGSSQLIKEEFEGINMRQKFSKNPHKVELEARPGGNIK